MYIKQSETDELLFNDLPNFRKASKLTQTHTHHLERGAEGASLAFSDTIITGSKRPFFSNPEFEVAFSYSLYLYSSGQSCWAAFENTEKRPESCRKNQGSYISSAGCLGFPRALLSFEIVVRNGYIWLYLVLIIIDFSQNNSSSR